MWNCSPSPEGLSGDEGQASTRLRNLYAVNMSYQLNTFISHSFQYGMSKITVPRDSDSGESFLPGLQMAAFSLCPYMAERDRDKDRETECVLWLLLS